MIQSLSGGAILVLSVLGAIATAPPAVALQQIVTVVNDSGDDTVSLTTAFATVGSGPATVQFLAGQYDFFSTATPVSFQLANKNNITIAGAAGFAFTLLRFHNYNPNTFSYAPSIFNLQAINGVTVKNLKIQMTREPYSSGIVVAKDAVAHWIELDMEQNYPDLLDGFKINRIDDFDPATRRLKGQFFTVGLTPNPQAPPYATTIVSQGPPLRVRLSATQYSNAYFLSRIDGATIGMALLLIHSKDATPFLNAMDCSDIVVQDVNIRDMPGRAVSAFNCVNVTLDNLDLQPKTNRLLSITTDAVHLFDCSGIVVMRDCNMSRMGDDGYNAQSKFYEVGTIPGGGSGTVGLRFIDGIGYPPQTQIKWMAGEAVDFYAPNLERLGSAVLSAFQVLPLRATFPSGIPPTLVPGDLVANPDRTPISLLIENCVIEDNIAHGINLHGSNAIIRGCTFRRNTGPAIELDCELIHYAEAPPSNDVVIQDCVIEDCNRYSFDKLGAITITGIHPNGAAGPPPPYPFTGRYGLRSEAC